MAFMNPLQPLANPTSMFEDMLRDAMSPLLAMSGPDVTSLRIVPRLDVSETPDAYEVEVELPGVDLEQVHVTLTGDTLTIQGEKLREQREDGGTFHVMERSFGTFTRTLTFPAVVDPDHIEATTQNGVLRIRVPKAAESKPRRIEVKPTGKAIETSGKVGVGAGAAPAQQTNPKQQQRSGQQPGQKKSE